MKNRIIKLGAVALVVGMSLMSRSYADGAPSPVWITTSTADGSPYFFQEGQFEVGRTPGRPDHADYLFYRAWKRPVQSKAVLIIVHGLRSHSGRYSEFALRTIQSPYPIEVWAYDQLGHGRSDGWDGMLNQPVEGQVKDIHVLSTHLSRFVEFVKNQTEPGTPIYILSHSMGGLVSYTYGTETLNPSVKGMVFLSPALRYFDDGVWNNIKTLSVRAGAAVGLKGTKLPLAQWKYTRFLGLDFIDPLKFSHNPDYKSELLKDRLVNSGSPTVGTGYSLIKTIDENQEKIESDGAARTSLGMMDTVPILFLHGTSDKITNPEGSKSYYANLMARRKLTPRFEKDKERGILEHAQTWIAPDESELDLVKNGYHDLFGEMSTPPERKTLRTRIFGTRAFVREDFEGHVLEWIRKVNEGSPVK